MAKARPSSSQSHAFRTTILTAGQTATGIRVPDALGAGKRPPVTITTSGYTYRSTVAVMGGKFMVGVSAAVREGAGWREATPSMSSSHSTPPRGVSRCLRAAAGAQGRA
jgi:hypothetical protein